MSKLRSVVIATRNVGKFMEIRDGLIDLFDEIYSLSDFDFHDDTKESESSYLENVMKKARRVGERTGIVSLADDSGLEVDYLKGRPGVISSRYGKDDDERIGRLLSELEGVPWSKRTAKFRAYIALYLPGMERYYIFYGELKGYIGFEKKTGYGFGFDPVFYVPSLKKYLSELTTKEKNEVSHRGKALRSLRKFLENFDFYWSQRDSNSRFRRERPVS